MSFIKLSKLQHRRLTLFITCLVIAFFAWSFFALSKRYIYPVKMLIQYTNTPQTQIFRSLQADTIQLQIAGTGWQLLFEKMQLSLPHIKIDLKDLEKQNYTIVARQTAYIQNQLNTDHKIIGIKPDTLFFDFHKIFSKKVPIHLLQKLTFDQQYNIAGKISINPAYITITGSLKDLEAINKWQTETLKIENVNHSIITTLQLKHPRKSSIAIHPTSVNVQIPVDEFTEKILDVPITVLNNVDFDDVKILPKKVKVTFFTALDDYAPIDPTFFEASIDLDKWRKNNYSQLPVVINRFPDYCKIIRVEPAYINFIIKH